MGITFTDVAALAVALAALAATGWLGSRRGTGPGKGRVAARRILLAGLAVAITAALTLVFLGQLRYAAVIAVTLLAFTRLGRRSPFVRRLRRTLARVSNRRRIAVVVAGAGGFVLTALGTFAQGVPAPKMHDEFSYLLGADTFAHFRLTNPTHPMWRHFETFHVLQRPTYASMYPPGQALVLAAGQLVGGHPIVGVWLSAGLACAALCWMYQAWLRPRFALVGALLAPALFGAFGYWGQSYWGGWVAVAGGSLLFGAYARIRARPRPLDGLLLGLALAVLAVSRPFEGLLASLPVAAGLLVWALRRNRPPLRVVLRSVVLPAALVLGLTGAALARYNQAVTGDALRMPYQELLRQYVPVPMFIWQSVSPEPAYRHKVMRDGYVGFLYSHYASQQTWPGFAAACGRRLLDDAEFFLAGPLLVPLVLALPWLLRRRRVWFALATLGVVLLGIMTQIMNKGMPHYLAPVFGLILFLPLEGMRVLSLWARRGNPAGRFCVAGTVGVVFALVAVGVLGAPWREKRPPTLNEQRARMQERLEREGDKHLVLVRYGPEHRFHFEWVYNGADIDGSPVVWAREMGADCDRELLDYYKDRRVWLLTVNADDQPPVLVPYVTTAGGHSYEGH